MSVAEANSPRKYGKKARMGTMGIVLKGAMVLLLRRRAPGGPGSFESNAVCFLKSNGSLVSSERVHESSEMA
ncbi:hypothetical protein CH63R_14401 [Colletotrichum higginsianum IMI 349063]|uniref:Uncharacterized protein n=1 Tax=Colletotrichum higginsianum (strain IMI 349063) TaxID=759273 RepID=A0A1B7XQQ9_COLHI|nr:hypothetical protein CH63R_14401 [Colletotrichum higginsianum IMI 349063]OBR02100.1 hypothetical protein CH63R_14401 [Colletotrichum higginsianum IMI 349063]